MGEGGKEIGGAIDKEKGKEEEKEEVNMGEEGKEIGGVRATEMEVE